MSFADTRPSASSPGQTRARLRQGTWAHSRRGERFFSSPTTTAFPWLAGSTRCSRRSKTDEVIGVKGTYCTRQRQLAARFVQVEYEDKYRLMAGQPSIDFVDTYSAGFRRDNFLEMNGYDTSFPVACAEDVELSYRMSARGWKMVFVPRAVVCHTHPDSFSRYLKKKYKFAFWRVLAVRKNPSKGVKDSHTPQVMKLQLLFAPALVTAIAFDLLVRPAVPASAVVLGAFVLSTLPFAARAFAKDPLIGLLSPAILAARACAQVLGVAAGVMFAGRKQAQVATNPQ